MLNFLLREFSALFHCPRFLSPLCRRRLYRAAVRSVDDRYSVIMGRNVVTLFSRSQGPRIDVAVGCRCAAISSPLRSAVRRVAMRFDESVAGGEQRGQRPLYRSLYSALVHRRYRRSTSIHRADGRVSAPAPPARRLDGPRRHGNARLLP